MIHMVVSTMGVSMKRTVSAGEARQRLGQLLEGVYYRGDEVVIERAGKPMAVVIPADRYEAIEQIREHSRERLFGLIEKAQKHSQEHGPLSPEEAEQLVLEEVAAARKAAARRHK